MSYTSLTALQNLCLKRNRVQRSKIQGLLLESLFTTSRCIFDSDLAMEKQAFFMRNAYRGTIPISIWD